MTALQWAGLRLQWAGLRLQSLYPISEGSPVRAEGMVRRSERGAVKL